MTLSRQHSVECNSSFKLPPMQSFQDTNIYETIINTADNEWRNECYRQGYS